MKESQSPTTTLLTNSQLTSTASSEQQLTPNQLRQMQREKEHREELIGNTLKKEIELQQQGRNSQTSVGRGIIRSLVPAVAKWLELHNEAVVKRSRHVGQAEKEFNRMRSWINDFTMAHIGVTVTIEAIGRGQTFRTPINTVQATIGKQIEDQAFIEMMYMADPFYFSKLQKWYLNDPVRRYDKKIAAMQYTLNNKMDKAEWRFMTEEEHISVGALILRAVMSIPCNKTNREGFFQKKTIWQAKDKKVSYLAYSQSGIIYRDKLQSMSDALVYQPLPMVCPPMPWSLEERGGFLLQPPRPFGELIHSHNETVPSQAALDALNRLQAQPFRINQFILDVQQELLKNTYSIGSFRSYEADTWKAEHFPLYTSEHIASLETGSPEYKSVMRELTTAYHQQKLDEKQAINPRRVVNQAETLRDEVFYTPYFFDSRLRLYPVTELGMTSGDYVKALMVTAEPLPITDDTRRELLIAIATSGDFDKISKKDYFSRMQWSEEFIKTNDFIETVTNPVGSTYWKEADEPFQFLAYCEEFYSIFMTGERDTTRVFVGRDMSCSGIQFLSSLIGDKKAMEFVNVIPGDEPRDAYGEVARVARELLQDEGWLQVKLLKRKDNDATWNQKNPDNQREPRDIIEVEIYSIDRGVVKKQVMVTGYGGSYQAKRKYILEALDEKKIELHPGDRNIVVSACIEAMDMAFPKYAELNDWFKQVAKAAFNAGAEQIKWVTPNGSLIEQDYREPLFAVVKTHAASGGHYAKLMIDDEGSSYIQTGYGDVKPNKHGSAIAANFTHSLDACMVQNGVNKIDADLSLQTVHDCIYSMPGYMNYIMQFFRQAFYGVVTSPVLENLLEENGIQETLPLPGINKVDVSVCLDSAYMFS